MSQPSSPRFPPPDDEGAAPTPRRLISPQERFAEPTEAAPAEPPAEPENPFEVQVTSRRRDEMERRHLPPRERARPSRARLKREDLNLERASGRRAEPVASRAGRAGLERDFARSVRQTVPAAPPKRRAAPRWLKRLLGLIALLFLAQLGFAAFTAPQFDIETVAIQGIIATPQNEVQALARELVGQNLLRMDASATERAVALLPTVEAAHVTRLAQWPPKVLLSLSERRPVLKVGAGSNFWVVDQKGVPFRRPNPEDEALYSVVAPQFAPQVRRPLEPKTWARAFALQRALEADNRLAAQEKSGVKARFWNLRRVYFDKDGLASLRLSNAPHREMLVRLGDDAYPAKLARARQSLAYFERTGRRASELDLVSLERPVWSPFEPQLSVQSGAPTAKNSG